jgi:ABC-type antimicrobial peptide transport system permease subunit
MGIVIGGALTAVAAPMLSASFVGLGSSPPTAYALVPILLLTISAAASYVPARRAAGLDPVMALRND